MDRNGIESFSNETELHVNVENSCKNFERIAIFGSILKMSFNCEFLIALKMTTSHFIFSFSLQISILNT